MATGKNRKNITARKRRPPQKNPPKKKNKLLRSIFAIVAIAALVAVGYLLGSGMYKRYLPAAKSTPLQKKHAKEQKIHKTKKKKLITVENVSKYGNSIGSEAMDFLRYGQVKDTQSDDMPDISWYEPGKEHKNQNKSSIQPPKASNDTSNKSIKVQQHTSKKPRLAIIIDDISHKRQLDEILALPYHITPSIFPPSELSSTSNQLTRYTKHFMVHLPLESGSAAMNRMRGMLFVKDSAKKVQARVDEIRRLFPNAKFINNHTGSIFTSNYKAMKRLYGMLRKKGFVFVDSRTSRKSKIHTITRKYKDRYIARDVFIDNVQNEAKILRQLRKAVKIAQKRGYAIAIGHPHKATMNALKHAGKILSGVQTVYIDELYR